MEAKMDSQVSFQIHTVPPSSKIISICTPNKVKANSLMIGEHFKNIMHVQVCMVYIHIGVLQMSTYKVYVYTSCTHNWSPWEMCSLTPKLGSFQISNFFPNIPIIIFPIKLRKW